MSSWLPFCNKAADKSLHQRFDVLLNRCAFERLCVTDLLPFLYLDKYSSGFGIKAMHCISATFLVWTTFSKYDMR